MAHVILRFEDPDLADLYVGGETKNLVLDRYREGSTDCSYPPVPADPHPATPTHYVGDDPSEIMLTLGLACQQQTPVSLSYEALNGSIVDFTLLPIRLAPERGLFYGRSVDTGVDDRLAIARIRSAATELLTTPN